METKRLDIKRGDIFWYDLPKVEGSSIQAGRRPVMIVSNWRANKYSPVLTAVALTTSMTKAKLPTHIELPSGTFGLNSDSVALCEQPLNVNKKDLISYIGTLNKETLVKVDKALMIQLELDNNTAPKQIIHTEEKFDFEYVEKCRKNIASLEEAYLIMKSDNMKQCLVFAILEMKKYFEKHKRNSMAYTRRYEKYLDTVQKERKLQVV